MRILMVENHPIFPDVVTRRFLSAHTVEVVPSIALARERLAASSFDVALADFDLDDGTGDVLVRELVQAGFGGPTLGISAHEEGNKPLLAAGARAACPKTRFQDIAQHLGSSAAGRSP